MALPHPCDWWCRRWDVLKFRKLVGRFLEQIQVLSGDVFQFTATKEAIFLVNPLLKSKQIVEKSGNATLRMVFRKHGQTG